MKIFSFNKNELEKYIKERIGKNRNNEKYIVGFYNDITTEKGRYWATIFQHCYLEKLEFIYDFKSFNNKNQIKISFSKSSSRIPERFGQYLVRIEYI